MVRLHNPLLHHLHRTLLLPRRHVPTTHHYLQYRVQIIETRGRVAGSDLVVLEQLEDKTRPVILQHALVRHKCGVEVIGRKHVDVHNEVMRGVDRFNAKIAQHIDGIKRLTELYLARLTHIIRFDPGMIIHDVQGEDDIPPSLICHKRHGVC